MKLAVIGSRSFSNGRLLAETLSGSKQPITCLVSGGANGADKLAEKWAQDNGIPTEIYLPNYAAHGGKRAPLFRNEQIVKAADFVLAFWDGQSTGTQHALMCAEKHGKKYKVIQFTPEAPPAPTCKPCWWKNYRGGCSLIVTNTKELSEAVDGWHRLLGCIQRMSYEDRTEQIAEGRVLMTLDCIPYMRAKQERINGKLFDLFDCIPARVLVFDVVKWQPETVTLTLEFKYVASDLHGGNLAYL